MMMGNPGVLFFHNATNRQVGCYALLGGFQRTAGTCSETQLGRKGGNPTSVYASVTEAFASRGWWPWPSAVRCCLSALEGGSLRGTSILP